MSRFKEKELGDIRRQIDLDPRLSLVLSEFNEDVAFFNARGATLLALALNFLDAFTDLTPHDRRDFMNRVEKLGFQPEKFVKIINKNASQLIKINPKHRYREDTLNGYYDFLNYADHHLNTASLGGKKFGKAAFPSVFGTTLKTKEAEAEAKLLVDVRRSLETDKTGCKAVGILAGAKVAEMVQTSEVQDQQRLAAYTQGIDIYLHDYRLLFSSFAPCVRKVRAFSSHGLSAA